MKLSKYIEAQKKSIAEQLATVNQELAKSDQLRSQKAQITKRLAQYDEVIVKVGDQECSDPEKLVKAILAPVSAGNGKVWTDEMREAASKAAKARLAGKPATPPTTSPLISRYTHYQSSS